MSKDLFHQHRQAERDAQYAGEQEYIPNSEVAQSENDLIPALSVKKLLDLNKGDIGDLARTIVSNVENGEEDLVETMISVKKAISFFEQLDENLRPMFYGKNLVSKGDILKVHNVEIEPADFSKWDFKNCNDEVLNRLIEEKKDRENVLKLITTPTEFVDMVTGSQYTANPPVKKTTCGYKITINS